MNSEKYRIHLEILIFNDEELNEQEIVSRVFDSIKELLPNSTVCAAPISIAE